MTIEIGDQELIDTWASSGTIIEPDSTKKNQGWTLGEKPLFESMNFLQNQFGQKINYAIKSGISAHSTSTEYESGDVVTSGGFIWQALADNTNSVPSDGNTNWRKSNGVASQSVSGIVELATDAETQAGSDALRAVTPAGLSARTATEARTGLTELATLAEVQDGSSGNLCVTAEKAMLVYGVVERTSSTLSTSSVQTIAHGLGRKPNNVTLCLVVDTAVAGWSVGDEIYRWVDGYTAVADTSIQIGADDTNIVVICGPTLVTILNKSNAALSSVAVSNFKARVKIN